VCVDEHLFLRDIERLIKRSIPRQVIDGFEPDPNAVAKSVFTQRGRPQRQGERPPAREERGSARGSGYAQAKGGGAGRAASHSRSAVSPQGTASSRRRTVRPAGASASSHSRFTTKH
jgi:ATP-dependent RNA helicase RhlE